MKIKLISLCLAMCLIVFTLSACGTQTNQNSNTQNANSTNSTSVENSSNTENSTSVENSTSESYEPSTNFLNIGVDITEYANQEKLEGSYKVGLFTLTAGCKFTSTSGSKEYGDITFPMACQLGGGFSPFISKSITFIANQGNKLVVFALIGSSSAESATLNLSSTSKIEVATILSKDFAKYEIDIPVSGELAISSGDASINIYGVDLLAGSSTIPDGNETNNGGYTAAEQTIITQADNAITWQIPAHGGWDKMGGSVNHFASPRGDSNYNAGSGWTAKDGSLLGMIDNGATYEHMEIIAKAYQITKDTKYKDSIVKAMDFLKKLQTSKGGFTQVYPKRGNYSDYVTINDGAMANVMKVLKLIYENKTPYTDIFSETERAEVKAMFEKAVDYLLKAQITIKGEKAGWCAQHDPETYEPMGARDYERPSVSGSESVGVIELLLSLTDNQEAVDAGMSALRWLDAHKLENKAFVKNGQLNSQTGVNEYIVDRQGSTIWYRFYDLTEGKGFFSDRTTNAKYKEYNGYFYDVAEISSERRTGYSWMGTWPSKLIAQYLK